MHVFLGQILQLNLNQCEPIIDCFFILFFVLFSRVVTARTLVGYRYIGAAAGEVADKGMSILCSDLILNSTLGLEFVLNLLKRPTWR